MISSQKRNLEIQQEIEETQRKIDSLLHNEIHHSHQQKSFQKEQEFVLLLKKTVSGFLGQISGLVSPYEQKYALAIGISLNQILNYFVVETMEAAFQVGKILKSKQQFKNLIVLENCSKMGKDQLAQKRALLRENQFLAFDLINVKSDSVDFQEYLVSYLRNTIVC